MTQLDAEGRLHYPRKEGGRLRLKNYYDELPGVPVQDVWTDIGPIGGTNPERLGYPTQKPESLLERIVTTSSNEGDVVLDPFCGCGTTIAVAQRLRRQWIGIDITYLAIDLIDKRLRDTYGDGVRATYEIRGIPRDAGGARALFNANPFDFERWAVSLVGGQPHQRSEQAGDKGGRRLGPLPGHGPGDWSGRGQREGWSQADPGDGQRTARHREVAAGRHGRAHHP
ncbi:MAG: site-specific DNA-methyltransferase [Actinomycetota bacterium]|nr:site-specific DNA-methyltransferase [Actinomycetota bacterium]